MFKKGYTLAEIVVVMLIIAVVVAITIKISATKLNNITSYLYYNAYKTLDTVTGELVYNFKTSDEGYAVLGGTDDNLAEDQSDVCSNGRQWNGEDNCVSAPATLPRTGVNFCAKFASITNTNDQSDKLGKDGDNFAECRGDSIANDLTDFSQRSADLVLKNGMLVYNMSGNNPAEIADLSYEGADGSTYFDSDSNEINVKTHGYTVYVDIDGASNGRSTLWDDIYPFYITMDGKVVPLYHADDTKTFGGNNRDYLMTSVFYEVFDDGGHHNHWLKKSVSYKEGACTSGYLAAQTPYCSNNPEVTKSEDCDSNDCQLKIIVPVKFFN